MLKKISLTLAISLFVVTGTFFVLVLLPIQKSMDPGVTDFPLLINNGYIINFESDIFEQGSILVENGIITYSGNSDSLVIPENATIIDATGKYLIPGFWDMHTHVSSDYAPLLDFPAFIANGVMNVRDMGGYASYQTKKNWNEEIKENQLIGPRFQGIAESLVFDLRDSVQAKETIKYFQGDSSDFIKIFNAVLPEQFYALMDEATREGVAVLGHKPRSISAIDASEAGMKSFEHARIFLFESYSEAESLRERYRAFYSGEIEIEQRIDNPAVLQEMLDKHDEKMFLEIVDSLIKNDTWFIPTHLTRRMDAFAGDESFREDERLKYISLYKRLDWKMDADEVNVYGSEPGLQSTYQEFYEKGLSLTGKAHKRGLNILAGTDANDTYSFPGFSMHDELLELVKAGLSPVEALESATLLPAEYFGLTSDYGSLSMGKKADILILEDNPLKAISNTRKINQLIYNGNLYSREQLDQMLNMTERNARSWSLNAKIIWNEMN